MGFLYGLFSLVFLAMLLQWTLGIDITELDKTYRLIFLVWAGWVIGLHSYFKSQEEKEIQEQLDKLRRKETVHNPRPGLMERYKKEQKDGEEWKKYIEKKQEMEADPRSYDPFYISDKSKDFKKEIVEIFREKDAGKNLDNPKRNNNE